jgi:microsomal dipeptidase-like Zn-dependent dipeptidase
MTNVDLQIQAAYQLEHDIDYENDCQINHNGWYRIARSPAEARQIIASGAMAVVLGIEVDTLFGCYREGDCTKEQVIAKVQEYAQKGVRHLFPVHLFDNAFGGTAAANDFFNFGNAVVQHQLISVRDCKDEGYEFHYGDAPTAVNELLAKIGAKLGVNTDRYEDFPAQCNERGLSGLGKDVIRALIDAGMIIDVDHMSARTRADVFGIAEQCDDYPGLVSGHSGFTDLCMGTKKHEGQLTPGEVDALVNTLHGLMAPILHQGNLDHIRQYAPKSGRAVANDCGDSATAFAQAYLYAVDHKGSAVGVGFGSDLNGLAGMPAPRFGPFACAGDVAANRRPPVAVSYPIALYPGLGAPMEQSQAGYRKFDINVDGFAHVGMFPDFVAELRALGLTNQDLAPLFSSAEAYIEMWERVERFEQTEHARGGCLAKPASP